ncbi:hypothetical protein C0989_002183 [Termitomyces sp. Mn162]|nr:hypothetical protein C0989_002183 [Termitomyces sp. Mn162]
MLSNWPAFTQEFSSKFGVFDTVAEAEENLFNLWMHNNKHFITFIVWFEWEAYETDWNYNALQFALCHALPQCIKDILCLAPKQTTYNTTNGTLPLILTASINSMSCFPPGQGPPSANHPPAPCPPAQLNAAKLHKALEPLNTSSNDS